MDILTNPWTIGIAATLIATVLAGLILYFVFGIGKPKQSQESLKKQLKVDTKKSSLMRDLTPQKIKEDIDNQPPLQRDSAAQNYKGIKVSWNVYFYNGRPISPRKVQLMLLNPGGNYPWISCDVDPNKYPQIRIAKEGQMFVIEGEIESIEYNVITLKNVNLLF